MSLTDGIYSSPINATASTTEVPIYPSAMGKITVGTKTPQPFYQVRVETGGNLVVETIYGTTAYYPGVIPGTTLWIIPSNRVLTSGTVDGNGVTTTAAAIWWYGGK